MNKKRNKKTLDAFGKHLQWKRKASGLSQVELEAKAGLSESTVGRIERGLTNPTLTTIRALAKALGIPAKELMDY